jgi:hypothetical protein
LAVDRLALPGKASKAMSWRLARVMLAIVGDRFGAPRGMSGFQNIVDLARLRPRRPGASWSRSSAKPKARSIPNLSRNGVSTVARQLRKAGLPIFGMAPRRAVASGPPCF